MSNKKAQFFPGLSEIPQIFFPRAAQPNQTRGLYVRSSNTTVGRTFFSAIGQARMPAPPVVVLEALSRSCTWTAGEVPKRKLANHRPDAYSLSERKARAAGVAGDFS